MLNIIHAAMTFGSSAKVNAGDKVAAELSGPAAGRSTRTLTSGLRNSRSKSKTQSSSRGQEMADYKAAKKFEDFRRILADVAGHPHRDYFILKSIIVRNLYGVDIMEEAVEICTLRLSSDRRFASAELGAPDLGEKREGFARLHAQY